MKRYDLPDDFVAYILDDEGGWGPITKDSPPELLARLHGNSSSEDCDTFDFTFNAAEDDDPGAMTICNA